MTRRSPFLFGLLLTVLAAAILLSLFSWKTYPVQADETTVAWLAQQTAAGRVPYRDFFCFYPPVTIYGLGALLKTAGPPLAAFRLLCAVLLLLSTLLAYHLLLRRSWPPLWASRPASRRGAARPGSSSWAIASMRSPAGRARHGTMRSRAVAV